MGEVRRLWIPGPAGRLDAALRATPRPRAGAVLAHPHPLHGGTLHNPVVFHADRELNREGLATLRFNFRGVETSEGEHDRGAGEVEDVAAAASWLRGLVPDVPLLLVGYSFGAWCSFRHALSDRGVAGWIAIGLPVRLYDFDVQHLGRPIAVVQGSADEFGDLEQVRAALAPAEPPAALVPVEGAAHLFPGQAGEVGRLVAGAAVEMLDRLGA